MDTIDATDFPDGTYSDSSTSFWNNLDDATIVYGITSNANYYKPIKGIPINNSWAPIPYFLPDDYVAIPFIVTPGATTFHQGDSITISNSEIITDYASSLKGTLILAKNGWKNGVRCSDLSPRER